jgi:hypothetical protein
VAAKIIAACRKFEEEEFENVEYCEYALADKLYPLFKQYYGPNFKGVDREYETLNAVARLYLKK